MQEILLPLALFSRVHFLSVAAADDYKKLSLLEWVSLIQLHCSFTSATDSLQVPETKQVFNLIKNVCSGGRAMCCKHRRQN